MIPILFANNETQFKTEGLGRLSDATRCVVTEMRNGIYELEMDYPITGIHFADILDRSIIYAAPSPYRDPQPFRVYRRTAPLEGLCTFYAAHISYDLSGVPVRPFSAVSASDAMAKLGLYAITQSQFKFYTNIDTAANMSVDVPTSTRAALGGHAGSVLDVYGGEYEWDKFNVRLLKQRGNDNGVVIQYGKNLIDFAQDRNISAVATGVVPYWTDLQTGEVVSSNPEIVPAPGTYDFTRVLPVDFSEDFAARPTPEQLAARGQKYIKANRIGIPHVSMRVEFVQLDQMTGLEGLRYLERCDLCDTVTVQFTALGVDAKAKIVKIETDVLHDRYLSVEVGDARTNIADTIAQNSESISTNAAEIAKRPTTSDVQQAVDSATDWITGSKGGYVIFKRNLEGQPYEILIMDTPDITTAKKVWRWNNGGLGYSKNGYNGPYTTAITQDGAIVADFITAGALKANIIKSGVITGTGGYPMTINLDNNSITTAGGSGVVKFENGQLLMSATKGLPSVRIANVKQPDSVYQGFIQIFDPYSEGVGRGEMTLSIDGIYFLKPYNPSQSQDREQYYFSGDGHIRCKSINLNEVYWQNITSQTGEVFRVLCGRPISI